MKIYKYAINYGNNKLTVVQGAKVISAGLDPDGQLCVWVLLYPRQPPLMITVTVVFTGEEFYPNENSFVGTVVDGGLMYHIFTH